MGMERVAASFADLDILFTLLIRSAVGARLTSYLSLTTGPAREKETDGPKRLEIIIVDNGRSDVLAGPFRDVLRCVRCGTCMLACPVYRQIGGHGYGTLYPGPLGLVLAPAMAGYEKYHDLAKLCTLCGACDDVCPVKIPLYRLILDHRRIIAEEKKLSGKGEAFVMGFFGRLFANPTLYDAAAKQARFGRFLPKIGPLKRWTRDRELPKFPGESFREWMEKRRKKGNHSRG
jgi:L-lactate dehydrogenase complex protein LldF